MFVEEVFADGSMFIRALVQVPDNGFTMSPKCRSFLSLVLLFYILRSTCNIMRSFSNFAEATELNKFYLLAKMLKLERFSCRHMS